MTQVELAEQAVRNHPRLAPLAWIPGLIDSVAASGDLGEEHLMKVVSDFAALWEFLEPHSALLRQVRTERTEPQVHSNGMPRRMVITPEMVARAERVIREQTDRSGAGHPQDGWSIDETLWYASRCIDILRINCGGLYRVAEKVRAEMPREEFNDLVLQSQLSAMHAIDEGKDPCAFVP